MQWVFVDDSQQRHDSAHLVTNRLQLPLPALAAALSRVTGAASAADVATTSTGASELPSSPGRPSQVQ